MHTIIVIHAWKCRLALDGTGFLEFHCSIHIAWKCRLALDFLSFIVLYALHGSADWHSWQRLHSSTATAWECRLARRWQLHSSMQAAWKCRSALCAQFYRSIVVACKCRSASHFYLLNYNIKKYVFQHRSDPNIYLSNPCKFQFFWTTRS